MAIDYSNQIGKKISTTGKQKTFIDVSDILYLECQNIYTTIFMNIKGNKICFMEAKSLKKYENELKEYGFFRVNNNTLVNGNYITKINSKNLFLGEEINIKISRRRYSLLKKQLL